jgi:hypothetical protein
MHGACCSSPLYSDAPGLGVGVQLHGGEVSLQLSGLIDALVMA